MAPRTRLGASQSPVVAEITISDLPVEALAHALGFLDLKERQRVVLVSKRFAAAACSPELLRDVFVEEITSLPALRSLTAWLARHGQHARQLTCQDFECDHPAWPAAVAACLTAASAAGQLEELAFEADIRSTEWLAALPLLQYCSVRSNAGAELLVSPAISGLTALRSLELFGCPIVLDPDTRLPTTITKLDLIDSNESMPPQVGKLPQLAQLKLSCCSYSEDGMDQIARLNGSLTRLELEAFEAMPSCLSAVTRLQYLRLDNSGQEPMDFELIDGALRQLQQLTYLEIIGGELDPPTALAGLTNLQRCNWQAAGGADAVALPAGPWLHSLRWLAADIATLVNSLDALQQSAALQLLCIHGTHFHEEFNWRSPAAAAFFDWLAQCPSLEVVSFEEHLHVSSASAFDSRHFASLLLRLARRRPALQLHCKQVDYSSDSLWALKSNEG